MPMILTIDEGTSFIDEVRIGSATVHINVKKLLSAVAANDP